MAARFFVAATPGSSRRIEVYIPQAKQYLGRNVSVTYRDRRGDMHTKSMHVHDVTFVPIYGACLVGDTDDIWLEKVTSIRAID